MKRPEETFLEAADEGRRRAEAEQAAWDERKRRRELHHTRRQARAQRGYLNREGERFEHSPMRGAGRIRRVSKRRHSPWRGHSGTMRTARRIRVATIAAALAMREKLDAARHPRAH